MSRMRNLAPAQRQTAPGPCPNRANDRYPDTGRIDSRMTARTHSRRYARRLGQTG